MEGAWAEPKNLYIIFRCVMFLFSLLGFADEVPSYSYKAIPWCKKVLTHGTSIDIHAEQAGRAGTVHHDRMMDIYSRAKQCVRVLNHLLSRSDAVLLPLRYPNEVEHMYSFVQVVTACTASFAHGANDVSPFRSLVPSSLQTTHLVSHQVSNAIGPYAVIYQVWRSGQLSSSKNAVPIWILVFGGAMIVVGLATYGYK
jgi:sodium-dependent phosphate transporter